MKPSRKILLIMSGSVACAKATSLVSDWVKRGDQVRVACTPSVDHFVGRATLEGLSGSTVFDDTFARGMAMDHIELARWADVIVACPASSNLINKFASGIADNAATTLWQAAWGRGLPMFVVPAMNTCMWKYPATRESVEKLERWGVYVLPTADGELACGESGEGRMLEPAQIIQSIDRLLDHDQAAGCRKILVTAGGAREPIDAVRYIGNYSTGRTGRVISNELIKAGHSVTWLGAEYAEPPGNASKLAYYSSFNDLEHQLQSILGAEEYDMVIHAAAVSDFSVKEVKVGGVALADTGEAKLSSDRTMNICLQPNPKLLNRIKSFSLNPAIRVIGFKLTAGAHPQQITESVQRLFERSELEAVVHNDIEAIKAGRHSFLLHRPDEPPLHCTDSRSLAGGIRTLLEN